MVLRISVLFTIVLALFMALSFGGSFAQSVTMYWFTRSGQSESIGSGSPDAACSYLTHIACSSGTSVSPIPKSLTPTNAGGVASLPQGSLQTTAETICKPSAGCPSSPNFESQATSMVNEYTTLSGRQAGTSNYGWNGASYTLLKKGGQGNYEASVGLSPYGSTYGALGAKGQWGAPFLAPAVYYNQGESEMGGSTTSVTYEADMVQLQSNYNADLNSTLGQSGLIPEFLWQKSIWASGYPAIPVWPTPRTNGTQGTCTGNRGADGYCDGASIGVSNACVDHYSDGTIFCIGPQYWSAYNSGDGYHKTAPSYRWEGCYEGEMLYEVTVKGHAIHPFYPRIASISGSTITLQMWSDFGPIAFDTTNINDLPDGNKGFEITDSGGKTLVSNSATITSSDTLTLTANGTLSTVELRYAWTSPNGACSSAPCVNYSGPQNGPRGNLTDSGAGIRTCWSGETMNHHALTFRIGGITSSSPFTWNPTVPDLSGIPGVQYTRPPSAVQLLIHEAWLDRLDFFRKFKF